MSTQRTLFFIAALATLPASAYAHETGHEALGASQEILHMVLDPMHLGGALALALVLGLSLKAWRSRKA